MEQFWSRNTLDLRGDEPLVLYRVEVMSENVSVLSNLSLLTRLPGESQLDYYISMFLISFFLILIPI